MPAIESTVPSTLSPSESPIPTRSVCEALRLETISRSFARKALKSRTKSPISSDRWSSMLFVRSASPSASIRKPAAASFIGRTMDLARSRAATAVIAVPTTSTTRRRSTREFAVSSTSLEGRLRPKVQAEDVDTLWKYVVISVPSGRVHLPWPESETSICIPMESSPR